MTCLSSYFLLISKGLGVHSLPNPSLEGLFSTSSPQLHKSTSSYAMFKLYPLHKGGAPQH